MVSMTANVMKCTKQRCQSDPHLHSLQPFDKHCPLANVSCTLIGPRAATDRGGSGNGNTSIITVSTEVAVYLHWKSNLTRKIWDEDAV